MTHVAAITRRPRERDCAARVRGSDDGRERGGPGEDAREREGDRDRERERERDREREKDRDKDYRDRDCLRYRKYSRYVNAYLIYSQSKLSNLEN